MNNSCIKRTLFIQDMKCVGIYLLLYSGAIKLMFPNLGILVNSIQIFIVLFCAAILLSPMGKPTFVKSAIVAMILQIISFVIMLLTMTYSPNIIGATIRGRSIVMTLLQMILIFCISLGKDNIIDKIEGVIIYGNTILLFSYFFVNIGTIVLDLQNGFRLGDSGGNPIWISRVCGDTMLCIFLRNRRMRKKGYTFLFIFIGIINLLTISKGPIIAMVVALLYYYEKSDIGIQKKFIHNGIFIIFLFALWYAVYSFGDASLQYKLSMGVAIADSPGSRMDRYVYTVKMIKNNLMLGKGLGSWPMLYWGQYYDTLDFSISEFAFGYPHNIFLEIIFESGIISFLPYVLSICYFFKMVGKNITLNNELQVVFVANLMYAMFSGSVTDGNRGLYCIFALCCGLLNVKTKNTVCAQRKFIDSRFCKGALE